MSCDASFAKTSLGFPFSFSNPKTLALKRKAPRASLERSISKPAARPPAAVTAACHDLVTSIPVAAFPSKRTVTGWPGSQTTGVTAAAKPPPHSFNSSSFAPAHGSPTRSRGLSGTVPFALI